MFFRLIWRLVKEHSGIHYLWPLLIALVVETVFAWVEQRDQGWSVVEQYWRVPAHWAGLASVYLTFVVVIAIYVKKAADVRSTLVQTLDDILPEAATYVGIGTIPLRQWFEPDSLVYLATIIHFQFRHEGLDHRRLLMFYGD